MHPSIVLIHAAATWFMVGLIWVIQLVHYPLMSYASQERFVEFETAHQMRISLIVLPVMLTELTTAVLLAILTPEPIASRTYWVLLLLLVGVWASTFFFQVPCHNRLGQGYDLPAIKRLVATNWIRTVLWTARGLAVGWLLYDS